MSSMSPGFVWMVSVRDLSWRWRRFLIATIAAALVLALTILLTGIVAHLNAEIERTIDALGGDGMVIAGDSAGPFTSISPLPAAARERLLAAGGVTKVDPVVLLFQTIDADPPIDAYVIGHEAGRLGSPPVNEGRSPETEGEVVIDASAGLAVGDEFKMGGLTFNVVGLGDGLTVLGERPNIYMTIGDAQLAFFAGQPIVSAFLVDHNPTALPPGYRFLSRAGEVDDLRRPLADTIESISLFRGLLWLVAAAIVGSVLYLSALERARDMAVMKATGAGNADLVLGLVLQAVALSLAASVVAIILAEALAPVFPAGISLPITLLLTAPAVALVVGVAGSLFGIRRVLRVDPALAFSGR